MKILVIGKEGRLKKNADPAVYARHTVVYVPLGADDTAILEAGQDADVAIVDAMGRLSGDAIRQMRNLKMIHSEGVGYQGVDVAAATERHIYVCNCKGMNASAVAEQAILLMLGLLRDVTGGDRAVREGRQIRVKEDYMLKGNLKELADCTVGLIGFGDIARATARAAEVFGAKIVYYRPSGEDKNEKSAVYMPLDELLKVSDIVSLHLPVTPETTGIVDAEFLSKMKAGSYLVNTARGELVDSQALLDAIAGGRIAGAGLDCIAGEPVSADNLMLQGSKEVQDRILYSPHVGGITASSFKRGYQMVWDDIAKTEAGEAPGHVVNRW